LFNEVDLQTKRVTIATTPVWKELVMHLAEQYVVVVDVAEFSLRLEEYRRNRVDFGERRFM
jgi:hypothetical protein